MLITFLVAAISLSIFHPDAFRSLKDIVSKQMDPAARLAALSCLAPILVEIDAPGIPASVKAAMEAKDPERAAEILSLYDFDISLAVGSNPPPLLPGHIRIDVQRLIPNTIRGITLYGLSALYFTLLTMGGRPGTFGKRLLGLRVARLDGKPLSLWESFERFGGYLASVGTFGLGFLDLWRDSNRRLAHDKISNTVVLRAMRHVVED